MPRELAPYSLIACAALFACATSTAEAPFARDLNAESYSKLHLSWVFAIKAVNRHDSCAALFGSRERAILGLRFTIYRPAPEEFCLRHNLVAFVPRGTGLVFLCPVAFVMDSRSLTLVLLHENLHIIGLQHDDSSDWNNILREKCHLMPDIEVQRTPRPAEGTREVNPN